MSRDGISSDTLKELKELAKCGDDLQLEATIAAAEKKSEKQEEYNQIAVG